MSMIPGPEPGAQPAGRSVPLTVSGDGALYDALGPGTAAGSHYDYAAQEWRPGHDHSHVSTTSPTAEPVYCGADVETCSPPQETAWT